ncbi:hypothetical protein DUNSADRAFT_1175 [Dunaliella salina]|uniref:Uncharacterized protein n=1 Tax=Dunaliella salina TaxID=3046 RepID=A0ABQ7GXG5_DUNSA|nr:hypothetical protein DUNSADRAFT_1175 [Dunaliella salina]|eukprot:KAF5839302.1 hypothetical protein DUNSADRAFT_1175 [Dunaliella salina]
MAPTTTSIAWCKHYNASEIPPELHNLRMSRGINVFFVPDNLRFLSPQTTYITALSVPEFLGRPDLPLLITEDDVIFTLDFNAKLSDLTKQMLFAAKGRPYLATLYSPSHKVKSAHEVLDLFKKATLMGKHTPRPCQMEGKCPRSVRAFRSPNAYSYASLGMFYSPLVAQNLKKHFIQVYFGAYATDRYSPDVLINVFCRYRFFCSRSKHCELFGAVPSMIEHTGAYSAIQGGGNRRFHTTANFPFDVAYPDVQPLPPLNLSRNATDSSAPGQPEHQAASRSAQIKSTPSQPRERGLSGRPLAVKLYSLL